MEAPPFSRPVEAATIPPAGRLFEIAADAAERAATARLLGLPAIAKLDASLTMSPYGTDGVSVEGEVYARLTQTCVVTSEDFESEIVAPVEIRFSPDGRDPDADIDLDDLIDPEAEDPPDRLVGGRVDLGSVATEFLALALDPYPRKPGASFEGSGDSDADKPFSGLSLLKKRE
jgi:hypothetical protein